MVERRPVAPDALLAPYLPRLVRAWSAEHDGPRATAIDAASVGTTKVGS